MLVEMSVKRSALFWSKVSVVNDDDSCWPWIGATNQKGYGIITVSEDKKQRFYYAHRVSYEWAKGEIPEGQVVRHRCDNPCCVRPSHLLIGTQGDNVRDMMERGRYISAVATLTEDEIIEIRDRRHSGETGDSIAVEFSMSPQHINAICRGTYWPQVGGPLTSRNRISDETIWDIQIDLALMSRSACAIKYGLSKAAIEQIAARKKQSKFPLHFY